MDKEKL
jgi:serine/threonine protein kinase